MLAHIVTMNTDTTVTYVTLIYMYSVYQITCIPDVLLNMILK